MKFHEFDIEDGKEMINAKKKIFDSSNPDMDHTIVCLECGGLRYLKFQEGVPDTIKICVNCGSISFMTHKIHDNSKYEELTVKMRCRKCNGGKYVIFHGPDSAGMTLLTGDIKKIIKRRT
jgi:hypothetical protein